MSLLEQFELFRRAIVIDEPLLAIDPNGDLGPETSPSPDIFDIVSEWEALRHEIKQQNKLQQQTSLALGEALGELGELRERLEEERLDSLRENDRLRTEMEERSRARRESAAREMALGLFPAMDGLDFAIRHWEESDQEHQGESAPWLGRRHFDALGAVIASGVEGLRGIRKRFLEWLAESGVEPIETLAIRFDPALMMAVGTHRVGPGEPAGVVFSETLRGYSLAGQVLRPAEVIVTVHDEKGAWVRS